MNKDNRHECKGKKPPEKIYLQWNPEDSYGSTWCADRIHENDIEYIRHTERKDDKK